MNEWIESGGKQGKTKINIKKKMKTLRSFTGLRPPNLEADENEGGEEEVMKSCLSPYQKIANPSRRLSCLLVLPCLPLGSILLPLILLLFLCLFSFLPSRFFLFLA